MSDLMLFCQVTSLHIDPRKVESIALHASGMRTEITMRDGVKFTVEDSVQKTMRDFAKWYDAKQAERCP